MSEPRYFEKVMTLADVSFSGRRAFVRVDFNVPLKDGKVLDDFRIRSSLPTIRHILDGGGIPILASHLGRPKGKAVPEFSLKPVRDALGALLGADVQFAPDCVGEEAVNLAGSVGRGRVLLLENLRFHAEEEKNDPGFSRSLASLAEVYVNDAFGSAHRAHASTEGITHFLKPAVAGLLMEREVSFLGRLLSKPERPFVAVIGGAKISGKIEVLKSLMDRTDAMLIGGGIANTFLKAEGLEVGASLVESESLAVARETARLARSKAVRFLLPVDFIAARGIEPGAPTIAAVRGEPIPEGFSIVDLGAKTVRAFCEEIGRARTIFWNGPLGVFEVEGFSAGTFDVARSVAAATRAGAVSVIGGGDTASAVASAGVADQVTHISTGGGASLEFVEGRVLPGIAALSKKEA